MKEDHKLKAQKITIMHQFFGTGKEKCGTCPNFRLVQCGARRRGKCMAFGCTSSAASDWSATWNACGLYDTPWNGEPVMERLRGLHDDSPLPGQESLF